MVIVLGSENTHKLEGVKRAAQALNLDCEVLGVSVASGVNDNPEGDEETLNGALNRAQKVRELYPDATYAIGIEAGFVTVLEKTYVINWCTIINSNFQVTNCSGLTFEKPNKRGAGGMISVASHGVITREDITFHLVRDTLILARVKEDEQD